MSKPLPEPPESLGVLCIHCRMWIPCELNVHHVKNPWWAFWRPKCSVRRGL